MKPLAIYLRTVVADYQIPVVHECVSEEMCLVLSSSCLLRKIGRVFAARTSCYLFNIKSYTKYKQTHKKDKKTPNESTHEVHRKEIMSLMSAKLKHHLG